MNRNRYNLLTFLVVFITLVAFAPLSDATNKTKSLPKQNIAKHSACKNETPSYHPMGAFATGQQNQGAEGDFSCYSDVFTQNGVRISPGGGPGRAYYDFGPVTKNSITVTYEWNDNAWIDDKKSLDVYNWKTKKWEAIKSWGGKDGKNHIDTYEIELNSVHKGPNKQIRVSLFGAPMSCIHLNKIKVE